MRFKEAHKIYGLNIGADNTNHEETKSAKDDFKTISSGLLLVFRFFVV
jgi:hypothetical protein